MRYKVTIEYCGDRLAGWQRQTNALSVQEVLESAVASAFYKYLVNGVVTVFGAGRTDAGVHAIGQVAHFDLLSFIPTHVVMNALNHYARVIAGSGAIAVTKCEVVDDVFHARFSAVERHYMYRLVYGRSCPTILDLNRVYALNKILDIAPMRIAANALIGRHDFTSFRAASCQSHSPIKIISDIRIESYEYEKDGHEIRIFVSAQSFLYHMVRNIVGTLVEIGEKRIDDPYEYMCDILHSKNRNMAGPTAPACGLYFYKVDY